MEWGDPGEALRAKAELAQRHAGEQRAQAGRQRDRTREQRLAEQRAVADAKQGVRLDGEVVYCTNCGASWSVDAVREATRRRAGCLLCGGPLAPLP